MTRDLFRSVIWVALGLFATASFALDEGELKKHPGYVDFDEIGIPTDSEETVEVYVKGPLLKLVAQASKNQDPALSKLLSKLLLIKVNTFSVDDLLTKQLRPKITNIEKSLQKNQWEKVVRVKEKDELVNVYLKMANDHVVGLVVMALDKDGEAVFVNIVGEIDMESIGKLGQKFSIPTLDSLHAHQKDN